MSPEEILQFLRGQAQGLLAGDQPAKTPRRAPSPSVLPVDVAGRTDPVVFYRDAYGNVVRVPDAARPAPTPAPTPAPQPAPQHDLAVNTGGPNPALFRRDADGNVVRVEAMTPEAEAEATRRSLATSQYHTADSRAAIERIMQQLPSNTRARSR